MQWFDSNIHFSDSNIQLCSPNFQFLPSSLEASVNTHVLQKEKKREFIKRGQTLQQNTSEKMACTAIEHLSARTLSLQMELGKVIEEGNQTSTTLDYLRYQSEMLYEHAVRLSPLDNCGDVYDNIILKLREVLLQFLIKIQTLKIHRAIGLVSTTVGIVEGQNS